MIEGTIVIKDIYVKNPPAWYRRIGSGPWEKMDLASFGGILPVVWLKPVDWVMTETLDNEAARNATQD